MSAIDLTREVELRSRLARLEDELRATRKQLTDTRQELMEEAAIREDLERENAKLRRVVRRVIVDD